MKIIRIISKLPWIRTWKTFGTALTNHSSTKILQFKISLRLITSSWLITEKSPIHSKSNASNWDKGSKLIPRKLSSLSKKKTLSPWMALIFISNKPGRQSKATNNSTYLTRGRSYPNFAAIKFLLKLLILFKKGSKPSSLTAKAVWTKTLAEKLKLWYK